MVLKEAVGSQREGPAPGWQDGRGMTSELGKKGRYRPARAGGGHTRQRYLFVAIPTARGRPQTPNC